MNPNLIFNPTKYTIKQDEVTIIEIPEKSKKVETRQEKQKSKKEKAKSKNQNKETI